MAFLAVIATLFFGVIGASLGSAMNFVELGTIVAIATMGGFIMAAIGQMNRKD